MKEGVEQAEAGKRPYGIESKTFDLLLQLNIRLLKQSERFEHEEITGKHCGHDQQTKSKAQAHSLSRGPSPIRSTPLPDDEKEDGEPELNDLTHAICQLLRGFASVGHRDEIHPR